MAEKPSILSTEPLESSQAKWISLKKINWKDAQGRKRVWEVAERKTRGSTGVDAVAILPIIRSKTKAFETSTVVIEQYRPPIGKFIIELPAGLIDEGETAEQAALRELEEETGYIGTGIEETSNTVVNDPGMTTANMQFVIVNVDLEDKLETPKQKLDEGEAITVHVVELAKLYQELKGFAKKGCVVDARLDHFATGYEMAGRFRK